MSEWPKVIDAEKRSRALDRNRSFIVQAPAGSGKTELLTQRLLTLLSMVERPEEVLAITFTRKAAGEMAARVMAALAAAATEGSPPEKPNERLTYDLARAVLKRDAEMGWDLLYNPARLRVQTMDSFCNSIVHRLPLLSRLGCEIRVTDKGEELYHEAARRTAALVEDGGRDGEALRVVLAHLDNSMDGLLKRLVQMLEKRDQWMRHVAPITGGAGGGEEELRGLLEGSIKNVVEETLARAASAFPAEKAGAFAALASYAASNVAAKDPIEALKEMGSGLPPASAGSLGLWRGVRALLLKNDDEWRSPTTRGVSSRIGFPADKKKRSAEEKKRAFMELLEGLSTESSGVSPGESSGNEPLRVALARVGALPEPVYGDADWGVLKALLHLLMVAEGKLRCVFAEAGEVDFQGVSMGAAAALGTEDEPTELLLAMDMTLKHILVDEYQDTSRSQLKLLELLVSGWTPGDGRTLFVVGDPMQSIYQFREAEVGLFLDAAKSGIGGVALEKLVLEMNFRSEAPLVDWVNSTLASAFPAEEDLFMGAIPYSSAVAFKGAGKGGGASGGATMKHYPERDDEVEAAEIVDVVKDVPAPETVAVLARSRTHLAAIVERLKAEGVDFRSQDLDPLVERAVISDLLSLTKALSHPMERVAWLALLRAPWAGLGLKDMHTITGGDTAGPVFVLLNDARLGALSALSNDGRRRVSFLRDALAEALAMRGRVEPRALIEGLWIELGGPGCYGDNEDAILDAGAFFDTLEKVSVGGEVPTVASLEERLKSLYASHIGVEGCRVEVMTIHRAKGLEFDHVIVPGLGKRSRPSEKKLLFWLEGRGRDLLLAPIERAGESSAVYDYIKGLYKEKEELEKTRLLYVAVTRAKKGLYLFGHYEKNKDDEATANPLSLLSLIKGAVGEASVEEAEDAVEAAGVEEAAAGPAGPRLRLKRLGAGWVLPEPEPRARADFDVGEALSSTDDEPVFDWAGEGVKHLGTVTHAYLYAIAKDGLDRWDAAAVEGERGRVEARLRGLGLSAAEAKRMGAEGVRILKKALTDEKCRWILGAHSESGEELAMTAAVDGRVERGVIDRTFVDEEGVRWIIDYKTSLHKGGGAGEFMERERERYRAQLDRYERVLRAAGEEREIRKALYYPALGTFVEV